MTWLVSDNTLSFKRWRNNEGKLPSQELIVVKQLSGKWRVESREYTGGGQWRTPLSESFKTKSFAIARAKLWMRKHPNG